MESRDREDKIFMGFMAVAFTVLGILLTICAISIVIAMWKAGLINFLVWSSVLTFIVVVSKFVYRRLLESDWL